MKRTLIILLIVFYHFHSLAQDKTIITGKINTEKPSRLQIFQPVFGYHNNSNIHLLNDSSSLVSPDSIYKEIAIDEPSFIEVFFYSENGKYLNSAAVIALPGDSVHMICNPHNSTKDWINFGGSNAKGQKLYNDEDYHPATKFRLIDDLLSELPVNPSSFYEQIEDAIADQTKGIRYLRETLDVTDSFLDVVKTYYRFSYYSHVFKILTTTNIPLTPHEKKEIITALFRRFPPDKGKYNAIKNFRSYLADYHLFKIAEEQGVGNYNLLRIKGTKMVRDSLVHFDENSFWKIYIDDEQVKEDLWALSLMGIIKTLPTTYDQRILEQFDFVFPDSRWSPILYHHYSNYHRLDTVQYVQYVPIEIVDSLGGFDSFKQVIDNEMKGELVYVDIWATWCLPCISAFKHNKSIDPFLRQHNIKRLYISIDNLAHHKTWMRNINQYKLGGTHVLCGQHIYDDLKKLLVGDSKEPFTIPQYLLINREGEIVESSVYGPEEPKALIEQIKSVFHLAEQ